LLEVAPTLFTTAEVESLATGRHASLPDKARAGVTAKLLGDLDEDLIFIPHGPCRIVDTRNSAAGAIAGNSSRGFRNFSAAGQGVPGSSCNQGGSGTGTGLNSGSGGAIALTVTGVPPGATYGNQSFITARPVGSTNVTATVLIEFGTPFTASNSLVIRATAGGANDFEIFAGITSHVVVDLLGFYVPPAPTALDCVTTANTTVNMAANALDVGGTSPACAAGFTVVSGTCQEGNVAKLVDFAISGNAWTCRWDNGNGATTGFVGARCCRTPGNASGRGPT
jgi:hypothetical protein